MNFCGAGDDARQALEPVMLEAKGRRLAFISVFDEADTTFAGRSPRIATTSSPELVVESITQARKNTDLVIVLPHWGREHAPLPSDEQRALASSWLKAGADLVVGSGPHVVQPLEHGLLGTVAWSLGNLVFDGPGPSLEWQRGALLEVTWDADTLRMVRARLIPTECADDGVVKLLRPEHELKARPASATAP